MTNKEEEKNLPCDPRVAALLAVHLVSQVLDEAYVIANAAKDSGQPWRYVSSLKRLRSGRSNEIYDKDATFTVLKEDLDTANDHLNNNILTELVTSTPQKAAGDMAKTRNEHSFIGQGDEDIELTNNELRKSTSMFINHLFDMSDVEHVTNYKEADISPFEITDKTDRDESVFKVMQIVESYVDMALDMVCGEDLQESLSNYRGNIDSNENSSYSLLSDAFDISKDMTLKINDAEMHIQTIQTQYKSHFANALIDNSATLKNEREEKIKKDTALYENAYLTLNRDYEQFSEEDEPVVQNTVIPMQEVELLTATTSDENVAPIKETKAVIECEKSTSAAGSRRSSLVRRCRLQGARLLSCIRGWWWRRKLFGKRKEPRMRGSIHDLINALSPDVRRRTTSLIDQRNLSTPSPSKSIVWKFNTVNEALVHSSRWKEFGAKMSLNENDEF